MDPLITNAIDPALLRVLDKRGQERDPTARRKRPPVPEKSVDGDYAEDSNQETGPDTPKHTLDDLA
jgi:hypothetical protein